MRVQHLDRAEFLSEYADIAPGEHVNVIGPTGAGKTTLLYQLLSGFMKRYPHVTPVSFQPKPDDSTTLAWGDSLGLKVTSDWPARKRFWESRPAGHVLWPEHIRDNVRVATQPITEVAPGLFQQLAVGLRGLHPHPLHGHRPPEMMVPRAVDVA